MTHLRFCGWAAACLLANAALLACQPDRSSSEVPAVAAPPALSVLTLGSWRGALTVQSQELPFLFDVMAENGDQSVFLRNKGPQGNQRLPCKGMATAGDSTIIQLPFGNATLVLRTAGEDQLAGAWVTTGADNRPVRVPLKARKLLPQDSAANPRARQLAGDWRVTFRQPNGQQYQGTATFAVADGGQVLAAFLTPPNDYLHLSGQLSPSGRLVLSSFKGNQAVLFTATRVAAGGPVTTLKGDFYLGTISHETWTATRMPAALPAPRVP